MKINVINILALEYYDKKNGNRYFATKIQVYGRKNNLMKTIKVRYQDGYGDTYIDESRKALLKEYSGSSNEKLFEEYSWRWTSESGILVICNKIPNCKKDEVLNFSL